MIELLDLRLETAGLSFDVVRVQTGQIHSYLRWRVARTAGLSLLCGPRLHAHHEDLRVSTAVHSR